MSADWLISVIVLGVCFVVLAQLDGHEGVATLLLVPCAVGLAALFHDLPIIGDVILGALLALFLSVVYQATKRS